MVFEGKLPSRLGHEGACHYCWTACRRHCVTVGLDMMTLTLSGRSGGRTETTPGHQLVLTLWQFRHRQGTVFMGP